MYDFAPSSCDDEPCLLTVFRLGMFFNYDLNMLSNITEIFFDGNKYQTSLAIKFSSRESFQHLLFSSHLVKKFCSSLKPIPRFCSLWSIRLHSSLP